MVPKVIHNVVSLNIDTFWVLETKSKWKEDPHRGYHKIIVLLLRAVVHLDVFIILKDSVCWMKLIASLLIPFHHLYSDVVVVERIKRLVFLGKVI